MATDPLSRRTTDATQLLSRRTPGEAGSRAPTGSRRPFVPVVFFVAGMMAECHMPSPRSDMFLCSGVHPSRPRLPASSGGTAGVAGTAGAGPRVGQADVRQSCRPRARPRTVDSRRRDDRAVRSLSPHSHPMSGWTTPETQRRAEPRRSARRCLFPCVTAAKTDKCSDRTRTEPIA